MKDRVKKPRTMFDKIWDEHEIADLGDGNALLHVDRLLLHDLGGPAAFDGLAKRNLAVRNPELIFAVPDHSVSSAPDRDENTVERGARLVRVLRKGSKEHDLHLFELNSPSQGIVHVVGPEQGITLPGLLMCCCDSHTSTHGALGAMAFGIGFTELNHVMGTQTLIQKRPPTMRVRFNGKLSDGVTAKDMILHLIGAFKANGGSGFAIEYAGTAIRDLDIEARLTICNMSIEFGAKVGMIAADDKTLEYLKGRPYSPSGECWDDAARHWKNLASDDGAVFDREIEIDASEVEPQVTWGTSPEHTVSIGSTVPDPAMAPSSTTRETWQQAIDYMGLDAGQKLEGTPVDRVFIGSCTNSRLSDLRHAAQLARGQQVATGVTAWVVPGSGLVKHAAEAEGLDKIFIDAGFEWRMPSCSMCVAANDEIVAPGERCVSTSNRNFVGRQGPGARTHLVSPAMAVAAAIRGEIADVRKLKQTFLP